MDVVIIHCGRRLTHGSRCADASNERAVTAGACCILCTLGVTAAVALGWDIGSGPTEAMCKSPTLRLKRTGMKRDPSNAAAVINLVALRESGQRDAWWTRSAA